MGLFANVLSAGRVDTSKLSSAKRWLQDMLGGGRTISGIRIDETSALSISSVFAATRAIAEDEAKLPLILYRRTNDGKERAVDEKLYRLARNRPNPECTAFNFRRSLTGCAVLWGNSYAEIERDRTGTPIALWLIHPSRVSAKRDASGGLAYEVRGEDGSKVDLPSGDMIHISGFGDNGIVGMMIARLGNEGMGLAKAAERFGAAFFGNGARPGIALKNVKVTDEEARKRLAQSWVDAHGESGNAHKPVLLEEGMEIQTYNVSPEESQFLETRQFQIEEVARWFRMPPHKIQQLLRSTFANIEHQSIEYVGDTMMPWLVNIEQEFDEKLLNDGQRNSGLYFEHLVDALLRADTLARSQALQIQFQNGALTDNEWRSMENRNRAPGTSGDRHLIMANLFPLDRVDELPGKNATAGQSSTAGGGRPSSRSIDIERVKKAHARIFASVAERSIQKENKGVLGIAKRSKNSAPFIAAVEELYGQIAIDMKNNLREPVAAMLELISPAGIIESEVDAATAWAAQEYARQSSAAVVNGFTTQQLQAGLQKHAAESPGSFALLITDHIAAKVANS